MEKSQYSIEEIKKLWQQEPRDDYVLKAATGDKAEYPLEVQSIIEEEAIRRGLIKKGNENSISTKRLCKNNENKSNEKSMSSTQKFPEIIGTGFSFILFFILYKYFGLSLAIPTIGIVLCLWVANKFLPPAKKPMLLAVAWQAGFILSFSLIAVLAGQFRGAAMWELFITTAALVWLIIRPRIGPVVLLTVLHVLTLLAIGLVVFLQLELESVSPTYMGLLLNVIFRVPAVIFMYTGLRGIHRRRNASGNVTTPATVPSEK